MVITTLNFIKRGMLDHQIKTRKKFTGTSVGETQDKLSSNAAHIHTSVTKSDAQLDKRQVEENKLVAIM